MRGVRLIISDACIGLAESAVEFLPEAGWQRCIVGSLNNLTERCATPRSTADSARQAFSKVEICRFGEH